jgi:membrane protease YdiL (CAAX protease family)
MMRKLKGALSEYGIGYKFFVLIGILLFTTILAILVWAVVSGGSNATGINSMKLMQLVQSVGMFVLPPFIFAYVCSEKPSAFMHLNRKVNWLHLLLAVLFMLMIIPAINLFTSLNQQMTLPGAFAGVEAWMKTTEAEMAKLTEQLLNVHSLSALTFNILLIAVIPALGEELFFRGTVQGILRQKTRAYVAIWTTAFLFSAIHMQFYGFFPRMLLGAFFGYLLYWSDNLWLPIVAHFTNNAAAIIFYYLKQNGFKVPDIDTIGTGTTQWLGIVSMVLGIVAIVGIRMTIKKSVSNYIA